MNCLKDLIPKVHSYIHFFFGREEQLAPISKPWEFDGTNKRKFKLTTKQLRWMFSPRTGMSGIGLVRTFDEILSDLTFLLVFWAAKKRHLLEIRLSFDFQDTKPGPHLFFSVYPGLWPRLMQLK